MICKFTFIYIYIYIVHFSLTVFFYDAPKMVYLDFGIIIASLILTFHHMLTHLFDIEGNCLWKYDQAYADVSEGMTRISLLIIVICFTNYLNTNVILYVCIYIYIYRNSNY